MSKFQWQLGRAVKAIDSKSIGATFVSSNLTAVGFLFSSCYNKEDSKNWFNITVTYKGNLTISTNDISEESNW